ncbi:MAG: hypothetical protein DWQ01_09100 [Planctomycetota bacterium]|nr:MAG: hypothetical protein DWQ01_09100 [Planctomycetota bacterium]
MTGFKEDVRPEPSHRPRLRIGVIGARRVREGTGPFMALHAASLGAEVPWVLTTNQRSAAEAEAWLAGRGLRTRGTAAATDLAGAGLDAVFIATPSGSHQAWLDWSLQAGLSALCEKPLVADPQLDSTGWQQQVEGLSGFALAFAGAGLLLSESCQWPFTLKAFRQLHPEVDLAAVQCLKMEMAPAAAGRVAWLESLSHPLSLLQEVAPGRGDFTEIRYQSLAGGLRLQARYLAGSRQLELQVDLRQTEEYPRPAGFSLDGFQCRRVVREPGYRIFFQDPADPKREVESGDPTKMLIAHFFRRLKESRGRILQPDVALLRRQRLLAKLLAAHGS